MLGGTVWMVQLALRSHVACSDLMSQNHVPATAGMAATWTATRTQPAKSWWTG
jgi:hypothetical protein